VSRGGGREDTGEKGEIKGASVDKCVQIYERFDFLGESHYLRHVRLSTRLDVCISTFGRKYQHVWAYVSARLDVCISTFGRMYQHVWTYVSARFPLDGLSLNLILGTDIKNM
jgi:hypothetical protein